MIQVELKKRQMELISYLLGMISFLFLGNILGENGITYIALAFEVYFFFQTFFTGKLSETTSKMIRSRLNKGQYKNANRLKQTVAIFEFMVSVCGSVLLLVLSGLIGEKLLHLNCLVAILCILAPAIFLRGMEAVLLSFFQADGTELPTVVSYLLRQLCVFLFSLLFIKLIGGYGQKVSALLREETFTAMYSAIGVAVAVTLSEALVLLFLFIVHRGNRGAHKNKVEGMRMNETFGSQTMVLLTNQIPLVLAALLQHLPIWLGMMLYQRHVSADAMNNVQFGIFYGKFVPMIVLFVIPAMILLLNNLVKIMGNLRRDDQRVIRNYASGGAHMAVIYGIFIAVYVALMAPSLAHLAGGNEAVVEKMLRFGSFMIPGMILSTFFGEVLMILGGKLKVLISLAVSSVIFVIAYVLLLNKTQVDIFAMIYAWIISYAIYCLVAGFFLYQLLRMNFDWLQHLAIPAGASCIAGLILMFIGKGIVPHISSILALLICLAIGVLLYWLMLLFIRNFRDQEFNYMPGGRLLKTLGQILRLY